MKNIDLGKTQITDTVRVSSAAIFYEEHFGSYWLYETFIFSKDPKQQSVQIIHGTSWSNPSEKLTQKTQKIHGYIAKNLTNKYYEKLNN